MDATLFRYIIVAFTLFGLIGNIVFAVLYSIKVTRLVYKANIDYSDYVNNQHKYRDIYEKVVWIKKGKTIAKYLWLTSLVIIMISFFYRDCIMC